MFFTLKKRYEERIKEAEDMTKRLDFEIEALGKMWPNLYDLRDYLKSEEFIDKIIKRINRKQLNK
jgi:hypothetical protein